MINAVLVTDPRLRAGFEAINQAHADALTASLRPNPTLYLDIQLLPLTRPFTPDATGGPPQQDVNLTYPIDWYLFGKRAANMAAAAQGVRVSEAEFATLVNPQRGIPPQANVIASAMFFIALALVLVAQIRTIRRKEA